MVEATLIALGVLVLALLVVVFARDRGRDRSARRPVERDTFDRASSTGAAVYYRDAGGGSST